MRLFILLALASLACRWMLGKWPWEYLKGTSTRQQAVTRARTLLGVPPSANRSEIIAAHRRLVAMVHPDRGGTAEQVHEANAARDLLLAALPDES
ncbi:J domain-containing protein [Altererythrobacter sp. H2]|uniref:J domain-containing protein n=1 Tax=Altererythrobacter sp. H2 TaxID=3108391 RepID=UPI002B4BB495|nr:J domain-containing protein [Altererythrobacter sp. H2]WRK96286.1 J domain-containing protein [Altererythrobacter sp. H2]